MKQCPICGNEYDNHLSECPVCGDKYTDHTQTHSDDIVLKSHKEGYSSTGKLSKIVKMDDSNTIFFEFNVKILLIIILIMIVAVIISNICGKSVKYDDIIVNENFEILKPDIDEYTQAQNTLEMQQTSKNELSETKKSKQQTLETLKEFEAKQPEYDAEIQSLYTQSIELESQVSEKQERLTSLETQISEAKNKPIVLPAGYYTVGTHIDAGRYVVTGKSNFIVHSSKGSLLVNTILGGGSYGVDSYTCTLSDGDIIKAEGKNTYTKAN